MQDDSKQITDAAGSLDCDYTSGFTESIDKEMAADTMPEEKGFGNIQECYVSNSGPTRLFAATRYGKRYMLKCLKEDFLLTPIYQQAIVKEFEIGLQLEHPYICRTFAMERFAGMGYTIVDGPEIEEASYNFTRLNIEEGHPSRDRSDTFYFDDEDSVLLRTQTSPMQIRVMENQQPPIRILAPGRVFRKDEADATHSPMFHQIEGLVVDEGITMGDLKGALETLIKRLYGEDAVVRFRPHHFPFTEPSCEVDMQCFKCHGTGEVGGQVCSTCHGEGWIELLGAGMVHPKVLEGCGIDSKKYSGFAFGIGLERMAMGRLRFNDLRLIFDNDIRFLSQF